MNKPAPNFAEIHELAKAAGAHKLQEASEQVQVAADAMLRASRLLEPLVGAGAAAALASCKDFSANATALQNAIAKLKMLLAQLAKDGAPPVSEDSVLRELEAR